MMMSGRCARRVSNSPGRYQLREKRKTCPSCPWCPLKVSLRGALGTPSRQQKLSQKATHNLNIHRLDLTTTLAPGHRPDPLYSSLFLLLLRTYVLTVYQKPISISQSRNTLRNSRHQANRQNRTAYIRPHGGLRPRRA